MVFLVILLFFFIEVSVSVEIASKLGGLLTFLEILFSAFVGIFILKSLKYTMFENVRSLMQNEISLEEFQRLGLFTLLGSVFLIIPGFFTDILGVLLQFSFFGTIFAKKILNIKTKNNNFRRDNDAIDVEVIDGNDIK